MLQILSTDPVLGCKCGPESPADAGWQPNESIITALETGGACKRARYGDDVVAIEEVRVKSSEVRSTGSLETNPHPTHEDDEQLASWDPLDALGLDVFQSHILTLLDSRSLARCAAVCSQWRGWTLADKLWQPLVESFLAQRAHLPLCLMDRDVRSSISQHRLYTIAMTESQHQALVPAEMCGRTWELRLKPPVGPYWLSFDPTQIGKRGLNRYFSCDGSITSDPGDPIWGGHASVWEFVQWNEQEGGVKELVQINHWPPLFPRRMKDGRWVLENFYGLYITRPDNPDFSSGGRVVAESRRLCSNSCTPPTFGFKL
ncbi:hypothetical protein KC19_4G267100 [Ceratodon purpureus]|uniref:F-box domain-containing protein n=1 Tax=Ceratodon purpureus TaxID=3225 RepID=A0A8T0IFF6_CERPU|nr:hypothetical protein KC19_4G267100 [Ceratodon purpureus]